MVAYSFKSQFAEPILDGTKGGTIRGFRRRHARPGEELQLFTGMRTKQCRLIARRPCLAVTAIALLFKEANVILPGGPAKRWTCRQLDAFAVFDGFRDWLDLQNFCGGSIPSTSPSASMATISAGCRSPISEAPMPDYWREEEPGPLLAPGDSVMLIVGVSKFAWALILGAVVAAWNLL